LPARRDRRLGVGKRSGRFGAARWPRDVMVGAGRPPTACGANPGKFVDGRPSPTRTGSRLVRMVGLRQGDCDVDGRPAPTGLRCGASSDAVSRQGRQDVDVRKRRGLPWHWNCDQIASTATGTSRQPRRLREYVRMNARFARTVWRANSTMSARTAEGASCQGQFVRRRSGERVFRSSNVRLQKSGCISLIPSRISRSSRDGSRTSRQRCVDLGRIASRDARAGLELHSGVATG
jgi:hypothetical protein